MKFTNISNSEKLSFPNTHRATEFRTEFYGSNEKIRNAQWNGFLFNQINKLTIKFDSILSSKKIKYYLKHRIPIFHRQIFRPISHNPHFLKTYCNDLNNPFQYACRK